MDRRVLWFTLVTENGETSAYDDFKPHARVTPDEYGWDVTDARDIWCLDPDTADPKLLVNVTKGVRYLNEIKDSCVTAFQGVAKADVCAEENLRCARVNIFNVTVSCLEKCF